jgi:hypothetical protein
LLLLLLGRGRVLRDAQPAARGLEGAAASAAAAAAAAHAAHSGGAAAAAPGAAAAPAVPAADGAVPAAAAAPAVPAGASVRPGAAAVPAAAAPAALAGAAAAAGAPAAAPTGPAADGAVPAAAAAPAAPTGASVRPGAAASVAATASAAATSAGAPAAAPAPPAAAPAPPAAAPMTSPRSIFVLKPVDRMREVEALLLQLFGKEYTRVKVHSAAGRALGDPKSHSHARILVSVLVSKRAKVCDASIELATSCLLLNALNARKIQVKKNVGRGHVLMLTCETSLFRLRYAEESMRARHARDAILGFALTFATASMLVGAFVALLRWLWQQ